MRKNGNTMKRKKIITSMILFVLCVVMGNVFAGNKEMVEKRVKELDKLNKEAVNSLIDIPKEGRIKIKAKVHPYDHKIQFDLLEKEIILKNKANKGEKADE